MKALLYLVVAALISVDCSAQDSTEVKRKGPFEHIELGVMFAPSYSSRTYTYEGDWGASDYPNIDRNKAGDRAIFGPDVGLRVGLILHPNMGVEFGVGFSQKGYLHDAVRSGLASERTYRQYDFLYSYQYVEVPVKFVVRTAGERVRFRATLGLMPQVLVEAKKIRTIDPVVGKKYERVEEMEQNPINLSPVVTAGIDVTVTPKFGLRLEPRFQHQLFKNGDEPLEVRFWSVGAALTAYFIKAGT